MPKFKFKLKVDEKEFNSDYFEFDKKNFCFIYNLKFNTLKKYPYILSLEFINHIDNIISPP